MNDKELLEYIAAQVGKLSNDMAQVKDGQSRIEDRLTKLGNTVTKIENDHGKKLDAFFCGYKQNTEELGIIRNEVSKQKEIVMRRVK